MYHNLITIWTAASGPFGFCCGLPILEVNSTSNWTSEKEVVCSTAYDQHTLIRHQQQFVAGELKTHTWRFCRHMEEEQNTSWSPLSRGLHSLVAAAIIRDLKPFQKQRGNRSCDRGGYETSCTDECCRCPARICLAVDSWRVVYKHTRTSTLTHTLAHSHIPPTSLPH